MRPPFPDRYAAGGDVFSKQQMPRSEPTYHRPPAGPRRPAALRARARPVILLALLALLAVAPRALASTPRTLVIEGAGEGHGVGMSQDGALGYARRGADYQQILAHYYTGTALGQAPANVFVKVLVGSKVKRVPLERYVRGVVSAEMSSSWPAAALEAQAVASRTYALTAHAGGSRFDVYADTRSQVYLGVAAETSATNAAVAATAGQIVTYEGKPAVTYFFASSGGFTENVENGFPGSEAEPWLRGVADPYETSASHWKVEMPLPAAARRLRGLFAGSFRGIEVLRRGVSPRIVQARVMGSRRASVLSGAELAGRLGLGSTWEFFYLRSGSALKAEPDHSGWHAPAGAPAPPTGAAGGVAPSPGSVPATGAAAGGTAAR